MSSMTLQADAWEQDPGTAGWVERRRYNDSAPLTVIMKSAYGHALALGGETAAGSPELLERAGGGARLCVAGHGGGGHRHLAAWMLGRLSMEQVVRATQCRSICCAPH